MATENVVMHTAHNTKKQHARHLHRIRGSSISWIFINKDAQPRIAYNAPTQ